MLARLFRGRRSLGGEDRLRYHGVMPLKENPHPLLGAQRLNLTLARCVIEVTVG
jgi:hypothetical protein